MNLLFTICARAGSKGVKSKNIRNFLNHPILYYTLSAYQLFLEKYKQEFDIVELAINTDSLELIEQAKATKIPFTFIKRRDDLGGDFVSKTDVIKDTLLKMEENKDFLYDFIVDLDLTSPIRMAEDIKGVIDTLKDNSKADVAFSVTEARRLPFFNMVAEDDNGFSDVIINKGYVSRQQAPKCFDMNASIYVYHHDFISSEKTKKVFDGRAVCWKMRDTLVLDIDSEDDLELMQVLAKYYYDREPKLMEIYKKIPDILS